MPTTDVTEAFDHYRVAARSVWNTAFWPYAELRSWDARDQFRKVKELLFEALVIRRLCEGQRSAEAHALSGSVFRVVPRHPGVRVPIMISKPRAGDRNQYWDDPVNQVSESDAELEFLDYFDWDELSTVDFQYYRIRITAFPAQAHLVGREALLEHQNGRVLWVGEGAKGTEEDLSS
jgi:hypothetical protein